MAGSTVAPTQVLNQLINDGLFDTLRKSITAELEGNMELKRFTTEEVEKSQVLQAPGAERRSRRELFESLRRELQTKVLERASEAAWNAILSKDGVGFQIEEQVEKTWWELNGWGTPPERTRPVEQKPGVVNSPVDAKIGALDSSVLSDTKKDVIGRVAQTGVDQSKGQPQGAGASLATEVQYVPLSVDAEPNELAQAAATSAGLVEDTVGAVAAEVSKVVEPVEMSLDSSSGAPVQYGEIGNRQDAEVTAARTSEPGAEVAEGEAPEGPASASANGRAAEETGGEDAAPLPQESTHKAEDPSKEVSKLEGEVAGGLGESAFGRGEADAGTTGGAVQETLSGREAEQPVRELDGIGAELPVNDAHETLGIDRLARGGQVEGISSGGPEAVDGLTSSTGLLAAHQEPVPADRSRELATSNPMEPHVEGTEGVRTTGEAAEGQEISGELVADAIIDAERGNVAGEGQVEAADTAMQGSEREETLPQDSRSKEAALVAGSDVGGFQNEVREDVAGPKSEAVPESSPTTVA